MTRDEIGIRASALVRRMEEVADSDAPLAGKWTSCKTCARDFNRIANEFHGLAGEQTDLFDLEKITNPFDMVWPQQKDIFDTVLAEARVLEKRVVDGLDLNRQAIGFDDLLHPKIRDVALGHYVDGDFRNAVLDGITAVFDEIRQRTGIKADGDRLVGAAFSLENPRLIFSHLDTDSGVNDQKGFMEIIRGAYRGIRNPKAHSLHHDLDATKAGQYLVFLSLLMRRVTEAELADNS